MLFKLFSLFAITVGLALQAQGHAIIIPALGVSGNAQRNNVQRPNNNNQCGNVNVAQTIGSSTPVTASGDGTFTVTVQNFNGGVDGSRQVTAQVDATGAGRNFATVQVTRNGVRSPANAGTEQITAKLPANTKCTGGPGKNRCLVAFKTAGNFGNCVVVQQKAAGGNNNGNNGGQGRNQRARDDASLVEVLRRDFRAVGTRAARALRSLEEVLV
ncbi:hypothetical protein BXZ70DRAFT_1012030 [Cristinia sonorae]|uniref:Gas1-like protein n=1 Tax=Cristinia sonorae TaxID=1940300 RepID=A0A8K0XKU5_9AGAR|nr:hypothetical protein BXZ70DRAFT_1012030 [Cristinia sonorae]